MQLHCMHLQSICSCRAFMFPLHSKHSSAQHLHLLFLLLLVLLLLSFLLEMSSCEFQFLRSSCSYGLLLCLPVLDLLEACVFVVGVVVVFVGDVIVRASGSAVFMLW